MLQAIRQRITEELLARRIDRWATGAIAVLIFAVGFIAGRWTSLTSNATPIVFQEAPGGSSSAASPEDLKALVAGASEEKEEAGQVRAAQNPAPRGQAPATAPKPPATPKPSGPGPAASTAGSFVASVNGAKYYFPSCAEVRRIKEENKIWFDSEEEAKESGYEPSACVSKRR